MLSVCKLVNIVIQLFYSLLNILTLVIYNNYNNYCIQIIKLYFNTFFLELRIVIIDLD